MLEQTLMDALVVFGLFVLRVGLPVAVLFGVARWIEKKLQAQDTQGTAKRESNARIIPFVRPQQNGKTLTPERAEDKVKSNVRR